MLRNLTLSAMASTDLACLLPDISERQVARGEVLIDQGTHVETVAFLASALVVNTVTFKDGRTAETFDMGIEGVTGLAPFLADAPCAWGVEVRGAGLVYEVSAAALRRRTDASPQLRHQFVTLSNDYQAQASLGVACSAFHNATARLASLLLFRAERSRDNRLRYTQEDLATRLGIQRTTVTASALSLKAAGAISYSRGHVTILDRSALARLACECHEMQGYLAS